MVRCCTITRGLIRPQLLGSCYRGTYNLSMEVWNLGLITVKMLHKQLMCFAALITTASLCAQARGANSGALKPMTPAQLVTEFCSAVAHYDHASAETMREELQARGAAVLPAIRQATKTADETSISALAWVLGGIAGPDATELLLDLLFTGDEEAAVRTSVLSRLENRTPPRPLTEQEMDAMRRALKESNAVLAGSVAKLLGRCAQNDPTLRTSWILARFKREVEWKGDESRSWLAYAPPRFVRLNQFLLAISYIGNAALPVLRAEWQDAEGEWRRWLLFALGMAGDRSVGGALKEIVLTQREPFIRWVAVRAYGHALNRDAVPLLKELLTDPTVIPSGSCVSPRRDKGIPLIQDVAHAELYRIDPGLLPDVAKKSQHQRVHPTASR